MPRSSNSGSTAKKPFSKSRSTMGKGSQGGTVPAFIFGMVFGLLIALGVALYVSKSQAPFSGASTQGSTATVVPPQGGSTPDPNGAIYNKANAASVGETKTESGTPTVGDTPPEPVAKVIYYLQVGSFRNKEDAEQLRAQLAFVGTESEIVIGESNGAEVNRVRVGPFASANEAYQARIPLTKGGFDATVVKE